MKDKLRKIQKALHITQMITDAHVKAARYGGVIGLHIMMDVNQRATAMASTPAWVWRHDKPKVDKRRFRRYQRGSLVYVLSQ